MLPLTDDPSGIVVFSFKALGANTLVELGSSNEIEGRKGSTHGALTEKPGRAGGCAASMAGDGGQERVSALS